MTELLSRNRIVKIISVLKFKSQAWKNRGEKEFTLEELCEIRSNLVLKESDRLLSFDSMSSQGFVEGPFYTFVIFFDSKGKK